MRQFPCWSCGRIVFVQPKEHRVLLAMMLVLAVVMYFACGLMAVSPFPSSGGLKFILLAALLLFLGRKILYFSTCVIELLPQPPENSG